MLSEISQSATVQVVENDHLSVRIGKQPIDEVAADKSRPTGHDHFVGTLVHGAQYRDRSGKPVLPGR